MKTLVVCLLICANAFAQGENKPVTKLPEKKVKSAPVESTPAETGHKTIHIESSNAVRINYGYPAWNKSATAIDSGSVLMREGASGRLVQIYLTETEPDSSIFSGLYSISFQNIDKLKVEFYVPPQNLLSTTDGMKKLAAMIASGQLHRNPFILRRTPTGAQTIEIFDSREQAQNAMKIYLAEQQIQVQTTKYPSDQAMATKQLATQLSEAAKAAAAAAERARLEQLEALKLKEMQRKQAELDAKEKARRQKEAADTAARGLALFREGKFPEATAEFDKAIHLDPDNHSYYFQYGVALYKTDQFNRALIYLGLADGPLVNPIERDFFLALAYLRMKDFERSIGAFDKVIATKDKQMAPSAQFYKGVVLFEQKKWEDAKKSFQDVLDGDGDPQLDKQAETYVEQILRIQQFETERSRKWQVSATLGAQYDSNINLISDSSLSAGAATNVDGYRSLFQGSLRYRPIYEETREFAAQVDVLTMYTTDTSFNYNQTLRNADPTVVTLTLPWTHKGMLWGKGYKLDIAPGYESISMSVEDNTEKEIIGSQTLAISNLFVMNERLYSNFNVELRHDQNEMASQTGDNDSTAFKVKLINSNLHFWFDEKSKIVTSEVDYTINTAVGRNSTYNRFDLAVGYIQPWLWETSALAKLGYYMLSYPQKDDNRTDNSYTLTLGLSRKLSDIWSTGLMGNYNINNSNSDSYTYKKWTMMLTMSAVCPF